MISIKDKYLTIQVVAEFLSCTERHIYDLIVEGELIAIKVGTRAVRVSEQSLIEFVEKQKVDPADLYDPDKDKDKKQTSAAPAGQPVARPRWMTK